MGLTEPYGFFERSRVEKSTLNEEFKVLVFSITENEFDNIGELNQFSSIIWPDAYNGFSTFELNAPITPENNLLLKEGNILWCGGNNAAVIEIITAEHSEEGKTYNIKGRTLESLITRRIVWGTYIANNKNVSTIAYDLVNQNCVSPSDPKRKIPFLSCADDEFLGDRISFQVTGGEVFESVKDLLNAYGFGFSVIFEPREKKLIFTVRKGADRTISNTEGNSPVVFSSDLEDILSSSYYKNGQDEKNVALVLGEDEGAQRKRETAGDDGLSGFARKELFVDARDLRSKKWSDDGSTEDIPLEEYLKMLKQRGEERLSEADVVETFEAKVRFFGNVQYKFGEDFFLGDIISVIDEELGVSVSARVTESEEEVDTGFSLVLIFGYSYPTILTKVKRTIKNKQ